MLRNVTPLLSLLCTTLAIACGGGDDSSSGGAGTAAGASGSSSAGTSGGSASSSGGVAPSGGGMPSGGSTASGAGDCNCGAGQFCDRESCQPGAPGECTELTEICAEIYAPVCGCDSVTYSNDCSRRGAGASLDHEGEC